MNKRAGTFLAAVVAMSLLANPNAPRPVSYAGQSIESKQVRAGGSRRGGTHGPAVAPPPDPRCFLLKTISEFYGSGDLVPSGPFDYANGQEGCDPTPKAHPDFGWGVPPEKAADVRFVIATVPDPVRSHLSLFFDRSIDAIEQAAQEAGYMVARAGMPWDGSTHEESPDLDKRLAADLYQRGKEKLPGLMIFRRFNPEKKQEVPSPHHGTPSAANGRDAGNDKTACDTAAPEKPGVLFVFVVGETPTGGIHKTQFQNALTIMNSIRRAASKGKEKTEGSKSADHGAPFQILGPTFSGSLLSLYELLSDKKVWNAIAPHHQDVSIHSGTATSYQTIKWFRDQKLFRDQEPQVDFVAFQESDMYGGCRFLHWAKARGYKLSDIAVLSEDETAYGRFTEKKASNLCFSDQKNGNKSAETDPQSAENQKHDKDKGDDKDVVRIYFPREISQLRNAYQKDLPAQLPPGVAGRSPSRLNLPLNLADTSSDEDSVSPYANVQYPLSQESVLLGIATTLRAHHTRFVVIRATDPLDLLFLTRYLRVAYPQGRVVTIGADLLFRREVEDNLLHGIMAITTYSLLPAADDGVAIPSCSAEKPHVDRVFPSSDSAGTYNAMLSLLTDQRPLRCIGTACTRCPSDPRCGYGGLKPAPFTEYGWPEIGDCCPAWKPDLTPALWLTVLGRDAYWPMALLDTIPKDRTNWNPNIKSSLRPIDDHPDSRDKREPFTRKAPESWILLCSLGCTLALLHLFLTLCASLFSPSDMGANFSPVRDGHRSYLLLVANVMFLIIMLLLLWPWELWAPHLQPFGWRWAMRLILIALLLGCFFDLWRRGVKWTAVVFAGLGALLISFASMLAGAEQASYTNLVLFRYIHITSGVSPLPSILFLLGAGLWWAWYSLAGVALLDNRRPRLPRRRQIPEMERPRYLQITEEGNANLIRVMRPTSWDLRVYLPTLAVASVAVLVMSEHGDLQTLEGRSFDTAYALGLLAVVLLLLTTLARLCVTWLECRCLLLALDRLPLRRGFQCLEGFSWSPIWRLGGGSFQEAYRVTSRENEALRHLTNTDVAGPIARQYEHLEHVREQLMRSLNHADGKKADVPLTQGPQLGSLQRVVTFLQKYPSFLRIRDRLNRIWGQLRAWIHRTSFNSRLIVGVRKFQRHLATACGLVVSLLSETWKQEKGLCLFELPGSKDPIDQPKEPKVPLNIRLREQFVCLVYVNFILTVLLRMRTLISAIAGMYVFLLVAVSVYPVEPKLTLRPLLIGLLLVIITFVGAIYAQMHRDATLSHITDTKPGELGSDFWLRIGGFLALPLISLLVSQFPDVNNLLFSWLQPAVQALNH
jgi:hypothetical protein